MIRYPILDICARIEGHKKQYNMLREYCRVCDDWNGLLQQAEREGMTPLLKKHLDASASNHPISVRRSLNILAKRHQHQAEIRIKVLQEVLQLFQQKQLTALLLKGAALCHTTYPDPALRPMRDMDILLHPDEVDAAQDLLRNTGFLQSTSSIPPDHHHLPSLFKTIDGMTVCIELHRGLYPNCPPYYPEVNFEKLLETAKRFKVGTTDALSFNDEEMLHYLYQHAFRTPLTYESYKLINAADLISFTEKNYATLDWQKIRKNYPLVYNALPLMHHISPWSFDRISKDFVTASIENGNQEPMPFTGWPYTRLKEFKTNGRKWNQIVGDTFLPSSWWIQVYYGAATRKERLHCILLKHPRHILWWVNLLKNTT